jgi:hypothetical protein
MEHARIPRVALEYKPKAKATWVDLKQDGELNSISKIEFSSDRAQSPTSVYVRDGGGGGGGVGVGVDDDDDDEKNANQSLVEMILERDATGKVEALHRYDLNSG